MRVLEALDDGRKRELQAVISASSTEGLPVGLDLRVTLKVGEAQAALDDGRKRELQAVIQSYFKDWLMGSGHMREVYDLARMEREDAAGASSSRANAAGANAGGGAPPAGAAAGSGAGAPGALMAPRPGSL